MTIQTYSTQQEWFKKNDVVSGTELIVASSANDKEDGWFGGWTQEKEACVGKEVTFKRLIEDENYQYGILCSTPYGDLLFPHFVLVKKEKVTTPILITIESTIADVELEYCNGVGSFKFLNFNEDMYRIQIRNRNIIGTYDGIRFESHAFPEIITPYNIRLPGRIDTKDYNETELKMSFDCFTNLSKAFSELLEDKSNDPTIYVDGYAVEEREDEIKWKGIIISDKNLEELYGLRYYGLRYEGR